ncbi:MAG TPA: sulfatase-like hydrolase/transferase [Vicinamibacterales bacterium]
MLRIQHLLLRVIAAVALLLVATYYLLASIPFSYYHFLQFPHFWWMPVFIRFHPLVMLAAVGAAVATLRGASGIARTAVRYVAIVGVTSALCMAATVVWPAFASYETAAALSFLPIFILGMVGATDLAAHRRAISETARRHDNATLLEAAILAALLAAAVYLLRGGVVDYEARIGLQPIEMVVAVAASLGGHLLVFVVAAGLILIPRVLVGRRWSRWLEFLAALAGASIVVAIVIRRVLLTALILDDMRAAAIAAALGVAVVLYAGAIIGRATIASSDRGTSSASASRDPFSWRLITSCVAAIFVCVAILPRLLLLADWGTSLQKVVVCVAWSASIALMAQIRAARTRRLPLAVVGVAMVVAVTATSVAARQPSAEPTGGRRSLETDLAIERYATIDTSLAVVLDLIRPTITDTEFFDDLRHSGDVTDDRALRAMPLRVAKESARRPAYRPNIFMIVVDSLRPDYLSAYNPAVAFTPAIGAFADESIVMRRAFAPYTGTALSQPSLWAGGLIPRRMYVQPFSSVNNLERLVVGAGYRRYLSVDEILSVISSDLPSAVRLDAHLAHPERKEEMFKFDLCSTLGELAIRLDHDSREQPIFFYSQPQSLHIRVLSGDEYPRYDGLKSGKSVFFKPAVAALGRIDACFGAFIAHLKAIGLYDDSVIVLTSDHGDFYGEQGKWGHAFYLAPETTRIPIIVHVPEKLLGGREWDTNAVAMLTDVTPTLYELLDYEAVPPNEIAGRTLLRKRGTDPPPRRDMYLLQSSYSRIFGLLDGDAQWMYTASADQVREQLFDLHEGGSRERSLTPAERLRYRKWLLEKVAAVNAHYRPS